MRYKEFTTRGGVKVLAGKNAEQNESLVKEFMGKSNQIFHTAMPGSPFCIATENKKLSKKDKYEIATFCAKKSQDWRDNKSDVNVHIFMGKDVKKTRGMKTGTFGVKKFKIIKIKKSDIEDLKC